MYRAASTLASAEERSCSADGTLRLSPNGGASPGSRSYCMCLQAAVRLSVVGYSPRCADRPAPAATSRCLGCVGEPASSLRCPAEIALGGGSPGLGRRVSHRVARVILEASLA